MCPGKKSAFFPTTKLWQTLKCYAYWEQVVTTFSMQVGFCTLYRLYAYPCSSRLRVSQILVLPPFQKLVRFLCLPRPFHPLLAVKVLANILPKSASFRSNRAKFGQDYCRPLRLALQSKKALNVRESHAGHREAALGVCLQDCRQ